MAAVTICSDLGTQENNVCHCFHCFPIYLPWRDGTGCHDLQFWMLSFKPTFHSPLSLSPRDSLVLFHFHVLEKEMATHSSVFAWRIPGMGEPGGLPSMGPHRVGHDWSDLAAAAADPDNYNGVIIHLEPDFLECEVKWALESITTNKAVERMEVQLNYFKS